MPHIHVNQALKERIEKQRERLQAKSEDRVSMSDALEHMLKRVPKEGEA